MSSAVRNTQVGNLSLFVCTLIPNCHASCSLSTTQTKCSSSFVYNSYASRVSSAYYSVSLSALRLIPVCVLVSPVNGCQNSNVSILEGSFKDVDIQMDRPITIPNPKFAGSQPSRGSNIIETF